MKLDPTILATVHAELAAPAPFCIIIDSNEQTPLQFPRTVPTVRQKIYPGDYSIVGLTNRFAIERKSLEDLIGSLLGSEVQATGVKRYRRDKLTEELLAMRDHKFKCLCCEEPRSRLESHWYKSTVPPHNIMGMIFDLESYTGVQFKFFEGREQMARWIAYEALQFWKTEHGLSSFKPHLKAERLQPKRVEMPKPPKQKGGSHEVAREEAGCEAGCEEAREEVRQVQEVV